MLTCSDVMLPVHGEDRDMLRLDGETLELYRRRLAMKGAISEMAGLVSGIRYLARAFGYDEVLVEPGEKPDHWAEATVWFIGGNIVVDDRDLLLQELNKINRREPCCTYPKSSGMKLPLYFAAAAERGRQMTIRQE